MLLPPQPLEQICDCLLDDVTMQVRDGAVPDTKPPSPVALQRSETVFLPESERGHRHSVTEARRVRACARRPADRPFTALVPGTTSAHVQRLGGQPQGIDANHRSQSRSQAAHDDASSSGQFTVT
jgi:hypothetical protein